MPKTTLNRTMSVPRPKTFRLAHHVRALALPREARSISTTRGKPRRPCQKKRKKQRCTTYERQTSKTYSFRALCVLLTRRLTNVPALWLFRIKAYLLPFPKTRFTDCYERSDQKFSAIYALLLCKRSQNPAACVRPPASLYKPHTFSL